MNSLACVCVTCACGLLREGLMQPSSQQVLANFALDFATKNVFFKFLQVPFVLSPPVLEPCDHLLGTRKQKKNYSVVLNSSSHCLSNSSNA